MFVFLFPSIQKTVQTWDVEGGRQRTSVFILILWKAFPEFGPIFLGRFFQKCPYAVPYIPTDENCPLEGQEQKMSVFIRFQATLMCTKSKLDFYGLNFCWLWFHNVAKLLENPSYSNQNFCFVFREFLTQ